MATLVIGLTGGIASGKSTVVQAFRKLGVPVIDADQIARDCLLPKTPPWQAVIDHFGPSFLNEDGSINRAALRHRIFTNLDDKYWLEALLHPLIHRICLNRLAELPKSTPYVIMDIPLLFESQLPYPVDKIWVVDCSPQTQIQRLMKRDGISQIFAQGMLSKQVSRELRLAKADVVLNGEMSLSELPEKIRQLHEATLLSLSKKNKNP